MRRDQSSPGRALIGLNATGPPDRAPVALHIGQFVRREERLKGVNHAIVRIDPHPQLMLRRLSVADGGEAGLDPQWQQQERRPIAELADMLARIGEGGEPGVRGARGVVRALQRGLRGTSLLISLLGKRFVLGLRAHRRLIMRVCAPRRAGLRGLGRFLVRAGLCGGRPRGLERGAGLP